MNHIIQALIGLTQNNLPAQMKHYDDFQNIVDKSVQIIQLDNTLYLFSEQELLTSVAQLVYKSILNNSENRERFLAKGSVTKMIDLIRINCENLHLVVLDIIGYLTDCPPAYPYLFTWYEKISGKRLVSKLCECWRMYDKQCCCSKTERKVKLEEKISSLILDLLGDKESIAEYFDINKQHKIQIDHLDMKDRLTIAMIDDYMKLKID
uniref:Cilia- and flagella-associated protein 69 ARM repeats domain-containing protein n=1 Tax=Cacopsylla melanoneura TaxID=428564 RepID=A0A8D8RBV1_9HEMI